ncbi:MAG: adenylate kinase [Armatimonadetes bacterium]|nr:adenylate kinase [Armatimonadota bacterium]MCX7776912.1 adenylate kinase [Armatimonadota bacterium]
MNLIFLGPPGSGKGTQASIIARKHNLMHLATGDIFRDEIQHGTKLGKEAEKYLKRGELVPDHLTIEALKSRLEIVPSSGRNGFVLDGFPRTDNQARELDNLLNQMHLTLTAVFFIDVSEDEIIQRLSGRRICKSCGFVYHLVYNPPKVDEICDLCGNKLIQREDDKPDVIKRRLQVYHEQTKPLVVYYAEKGLLHFVNGSGSIEEVEQRIEKVLEFIQEGS